MLGTVGIDLDLRLATTADLDVVVDILRDAARWLADRGIEQWPSDGFPAHTIAERIDRGETYLAEIDGMPVATVSIDWADPGMWGLIQGNDGLAAYAHRMAVRRAWAGQRLGEQLLDFVRRKARDAGRPLVRLDCVTANRALCRYYEARGWTHVRDITDEIGTESLFEQSSGLLVP
jgi:GNAT superfamily N-acetyltransferase